MANILRSPLFYVGDKYKLMKQLLNYFPEKINNYYEPFCGGGTVFLNVNAKEYHINDISEHIINIHKYLISNADKPESFIKRVNNIITKYNLSQSFKEDIIPIDLKNKWNKTYFAHFNRNGYNKLKDDFNKNNNYNPFVLYILLIYGFNRMIRFNRAGKFNIPVGNVDFNKNVEMALRGYFNFVNNKIIKLYSKDFVNFIEDIKFKKNDYIYLDPPYLIAQSEYNKIWDSEKEEILINILDKLDKIGVIFALSNVTYYKGKSNELLINWMNKYNSYNIDSNYISYHHNGKKQICEVLITNFKNI